jgi:hypothetical protein
MRDERLVTLLSSSFLFLDTNDFSPAGAAGVTISWMFRKQLSSRMPRRL